jgi:SAM-dependent methyltransferase
MSRHELSAILVAGVVVAALAATGGVILCRTFPTLWDKLTHPLVWPVDLGPPEQLLAQMADKYNQEAEVRYASEQVKEGLDEIEQALVNGPMARRGRVLDVGCGAGREAIALVKLGYAVVGIDIAERAVEAAKRNAIQHGVEASFSTLAAHEVTPHQLGKFDYVLTTSAFYTFLPTRRLRIQTLRALKGVLKPHGLVFLSAPLRAPSQRIGPRARLVDWLRGLRGLLPGQVFTAEWGDQLSGYVSPVSDVSQPVFLRVFDSREAIEAEIQAAGLVSVSEPMTAWMWSLRALPQVVEATATNVMTREGHHHDKR